MYTPGNKISSNMKCRVSGANVQTERQKGGKVICIRPVGPKNNNLNLGIKTESVSSCQIYVNKIHIYTVAPAPAACQAQYLCGVRDYFWDSVS